MGIAGNISGPVRVSGYTEPSSVLRAEASDNFLIIPNGDFVLEAGYERRYSMASPVSAQHLS